MEQSHDERSDGKLALSDFFAKLEPRLEATRNLERELDRHLAHRFNVLDYLRTDELGLSRIIADLLNPRAKHGQGPLFLKTLLDMLQPTTHWPDLDVDGAAVVTERVIEEQRRIDIDVRVRDRNGALYCLAIENKPYVGDQNTQVVDYLRHLEKYTEHGGRFLLIYLSSDGHPPSEESLPRTDLERWPGRLLIMSYIGSSDHSRIDDPFRNYRASIALTDWLSESRQKCQVERLRWFLSDTALFCQGKFGDRHMTSDIESGDVQQFLSENAKYMTAARVVYDAWPDVRHDVCVRFLGHLRDCFSREFENEVPQLTSGVEVEYETGKYGLWLYRASWKKYEIDGSVSPRQIRIGLEAESSKRADGWYFCVRVPPKKGNLKSADEEQDRSDRLKSRLNVELSNGDRPTEPYPWWRYARHDFRDWNTLAPTLHAESKGSGDTVTNYFVDELLKVARKAIPVIDTFDG